MFFKIFSGQNSENSLHLFINGKSHRHYLITFDISLQIQVIYMVKPFYKYLACTVILITTISLFFRLEAEDFSWVLRTMEESVWVPMKATKSVLLKVFQSWFNKLVCTSNRTWNLGDCVSNSLWLRALASKHTLNIWSSYFWLIQGRDRINCENYSLYQH